jgi:SOS response regulatory protein OraA/RecX
VPRVTKLRPSRGGRYVVHLDEVNVGTISEAAVARHRLHLERELSEEEAQALRDDALVDGALAAAYRLLAQRSRSRHELGQRLTLKGHTEDVVAVVLDRLAQQGMLDDAAFAAAFVADKRGLAGWGGERIAAELRRLGVSPAIIEAALGSPESDDDAEAARAAALLARMGAPGTPLDAARRRAFERLRRRGFSTSVAYAAVQSWAMGAGSGAASRAYDTTDNTYDDATTPDEGSG